MYIILSYNTIHRHVSVASAPIIRLSHCKANSANIYGQRVQRKPRLLLLIYCAHFVVIKCQTMLPLKIAKTWCVYVAS